MHCVTTTAWVASWLSPRTTHDHILAWHTHHSSVALQSIVRGQCIKYLACVKLEMDCTVVTNVKVTFKKVTVTVTKLHRMKVTSYFSEVTTPTLLLDLFAKSKRCTPCMLFDGWAITCINGMSNNIG